MQGVEFTKIKWLMQQAADLKGNTWAKCQSTGNLGRFTTDSYDSAAQGDKC